MRHPILRYAGLIIVLCVVSMCAGAGLYVVNVARIYEETRHRAGRALDDVILASCAALVLFGLIAFVGTIVAYNVCRERELEELDRAHAESDSTPIE